MEEHLFTTAYSAPLQWASRIIVLDKSLRGFRMTPSALIGRDMATYWLDR
jgi:hypothetical protein